MEINANQFKEIKPKLPTKEEVEFFETLEGKTIKYIKECLENKRSFEGYVYSWALIEQVLLVKLIKFIAKHLKIDVPGGVWKMNQMAINYFYYAISHDKELYDNLEMGRKKRNKITHELINQHSSDLLKGDIKKALLHDWKKIISLIFDRLSGKETVPSLKLYSDGWNNAINRCVEIIKSV